MFPSRLDGIRLHEKARGSETGRAILLACEQVQLEGIGVRVPAERHENTKTRDESAGVVAEGGESIDQVHLHFAVPLQLLVHERRLLGEEPAPTLEIRCLLAFGIDLVESDDPWPC
jgi:hypothetical protein